ncbi:MAG TPA: XdhC/CoxI family protein [Candidatus Nitrosotalea sp.]|nr:XdhC/CoxI family protein [Candidatus Nitrosotalea sp.]
MPSLEEDLARRVARGEEVVLATVIKLDGKPPSHPGAKILLSRTATLAGTLGCSEFDSAALADAGRIADAGAPELRTYSHDLGSIEVYLEPYPAAPTLVVFAATPVAASLLRWAPDLGFRILLVETRQDRLKNARWPPAITSLADLPGALGPDVYVVHTDHDAEDLVQALEAVLPKEPRFIGLVGSRRHTGHHLEALRAKGVAEEVIARIQSPVGLDIGAQTPGEIALSILAGITAIRREARIKR